MTVTCETPESSTPPSIDLVASIREVAAATDSAPDLCRQCFRQILTHYNSPAGILHLSSSVAATSERFFSTDNAAQTWQRSLEALALSANYQNRPECKLFEAELSGQVESAVVAILAVPLYDADHSSIGSLALVASCQSQVHMQTQLNELQTIVGMMEAIAGVSASPTMHHGGQSPDRQPENGEAASNQPRAKSDSAAVSGLAKAGEHESMHDFAFAITNNLKSKLGCDLVCLGRVVRKQIKLMSLSGLDDVYPRSPGARQIEQALEECFDAGKAMCFQREDKWSEEHVSTGHRLHRIWHSNSANAPVASVPLFVGEECVAVIGLRNPGNQTFTIDTLTKVQKMVGPLMPGLLLLEKSSQSLGRHVRSSLGTAFASLFGRESRGRLLMTAVTVFVSLWAVLGKQDFVISVPCEVVPEHRQLSAPFDGPIANVDVQPGEFVRRGQRLLTMDVAELTLERHRIEAERRAALIELNQAASEGSPDVSALAGQKLQIAEIALKLNEYRGRVATIRAPIDGVVLTEDLQRRVGEVVPLGEPLLRIRPQQVMAIELVAPEKNAVYLRTGQVGEFTVSARPDLSTACRIDRVAPAASVEDGQSIFRVVCHISEEMPAWQRAGMQGVAKINAGKKPVWWVWSHQVINGVRLKLWML